MRTQIQKEILAQVEKDKDKILEIAGWLKENPETPMEEYKSSAFLADFLEKEGFEVERNLAGLETSFRGVKRRGNGPRIAIPVEYDALPGLGHACGHHLISAISIGAGLAAAKALDTFEGEIALIGTPGEEAGEGKPHLVEHGIFDGYDAAMMVHPYVLTDMYPEMICIGGIDFNFTGKSAHAGGTPEQGVNALDAVVIFYTAINAMRQQLRDGSRIHGIILEAGDAPNSIPDKGRVRMEYRFAELDYFNELEQRMIRCAEGAATATGCTLTYEHFEPTCENMKHNKTLGAIFKGHMESMGIHENGVCGKGSSDMGNVSQVVPAIHPMFQMVENVEGVHTREFLEATASEFTKERLMVAAQLLALTALSLLEDPQLARSLKEQG